MDAGKSLATYLTDHMAGSVTAYDLARRGAEANQGPVAQFFGSIENNGGETWTRHRVVRGKPNMREEDLAIASPGVAFHLGVKERCFEGGGHAGESGNETVDGLTC